MFTNRLLSFTAAVVTVLCVSATNLAGQGSITGVVRDGQTLQPLSAVQIVLPNLNTGTLSEADGRFILINVPNGTHTLQAQRLGYNPGSQEVTVSAGQTATVSFDLEQTAIGLDEIVVTGTGAPTERRRLGQSITSVTSDELAIAPITDVAGALSGRVPGAQGLMTGGQTGNGSRIILRGTTSVGQRQDPIIYVDGVRIDNSTDGMQSVTPDRLMDINPQDIDRIEVIKGAAAATLFGTEASSGVIQIFTKRGQSGAPQYSIATDWHHLAFPREFEDNCAYDRPNHQIICENPYDLHEEFGYHQNYNLSVRGGMPSVTYYLSGRLMDENNPSPNNELGNQSIRAGLNFNNTERLSSTIDISTVRRQIVASTPGWGDVFGNLMLGHPLNVTETNQHGTFEPFMTSQVTENLQESVNTLLSGSMAYQWTDGLSSNLQLGYNFIDSRESSFKPQGVVQESITGTKSVGNSRGATTTVDFSTNWERQLTDRLMGNVTVGAQTFRETSTSESAAVREFGSPTLSTLSGGAEITAASETFREVVNAGMFFQGQVGLDNRLFLTGGVRADGNSAFGENFGIQAYPKAGLSWVVSDYDFWNVGWVDELRLRGALGSSGLQPGAFDALRTWSPEKSILGGHISPDNLGNPDLKPERSTEIELAIETGMFGGRFGAELVYFNQTTTDALLNVAPSPGTGFTSSQLRNLGTLKSWGLELSTQARLVQRPGFTWDLTVAPTYLKQWVDDMGGLEGFRMGSRRKFDSLYEGYWPGIWIAPIANPDEPYKLAKPIDQIRDRRDIFPNLLKAADGTDSMVVIGRPAPNRTIDIGSTFQIGDNITIRNAFAGAAGFMMTNETDHLRNALGNNPLVANLEYALNDPNTSTERKMELVDIYGRKESTVQSNTMYPGDNLRWNEATVAYRLPDAWSSRFGSSSTTVSLGVRNVYVFSDYFNDFKLGVADPGTRGLDSNVFTQNTDYLKTPPPRRFVLSLRTDF